jgi:hypothetical protein
LRRRQHRRNGVDARPHQQGYLARARIEHAGANCAFPQRTKSAALKFFDLRGVVKVQLPLVLDRRHTRPIFHSKCAGIIA